MSTAEQTLIGRPLAVSHLRGQGFSWLISDTCHRGHSAYSLTNFAPRAVRRGPRQAGTTAPHTKMNKTLGIQDACESGI